MLSILDAKEHARILQDEINICMTAGVQKRFLHESMTAHCGDGEVEWVRNFRQYQVEGCPGLVLEGIARPDSRCQAIAAALVRNFIDARVVPVNTLVDSAMSGDAPNPTVLLIPNLYTVVLHKQVPAWKSQIMYDLLLERSTKGKPSVVYVEDLEAMVGVYGKPFRDFLDSFKRIVE